MHGWGKRAGVGVLGGVLGNRVLFRFLQIAYVVVSLVHEGEMGERLKKRALEAALWKKY